MDALKSIHFYRKVPRDLTEATLAGGTISLISSIVMAYLFITNFSAYLRVDTKTSIVLDASQEKKLQLNFNVTLYHLPCRFATLDIVDVMGTHFQNVSTNIIKTRVETTDDTGAVKLLGRAIPKKDPVYADSLTPAGVEVSKNAPELSQEQFLAAVKSKQLVMINFYAPWCPWSRRLQPVWEEAYGNIMKKGYANDVLFAKADCTSPGGQELCHLQHVHAFPTVKIYAGTTRTRTRATWATGRTRRSRRSSTRTCTTPTTPRRWPRETSSWARGGTRGASCAASCW